MKRVLFMHHISVVGGGSYCLLNILKEIDRSVVEPMVCLASDGPLKKEIDKLGIEVVFFKEMCVIPYNKSLFRYSSLSAFNDIKKSIPSFKKIISDNQIDVVYLNNLMLCRYLKPAKKCGCKTIIHCREHWPMNEHKVQLKWAQTAVYRYADELIAINRYSASMFPKKTAVIVYDWIDMDSRYEYRPMKQILGEDTEKLKVYLYTGGFEKIKGCLEVFSAFSECVREPNARLLALGVNIDIKIQKYKIFLAKFGIKCYTYKLQEIIKNDARIRCIPLTYKLSHIIQQCYCNLSFFRIPHANLALAECEILGVPSIAAETDESMEYSLEGQLSCLYDFKSYGSFKKSLSELDYRYPALKNNIAQKSEELRLLFDKKNNIIKLNRVFLHI